MLSLQKYWHELRQKVIEFVGSIFLVPELGIQNCFPEAIWFCLLAFIFMHLASCLLIALGHKLHLAFSSSVCLQYFVRAFSSLFCPHSKVIHRKLTLSVT